MKKFLLQAFLCLASYGVLSAQSPNHLRSAFQFSIVPKLSTNGLEASKYTNSVSFNLLVGISQNEEAFTFGSIGNIILNDASGFQFGGLFNYTGRNSQGFQFAGLSNYVGNKGQGFLCSGISNVVIRDYEGLMFGGIFNSARKVSGVQVAGISNMALNDLSGLQFAGIKNLAHGMEGVQIAGIANAMKNGTGVQFAGIGNISRDIEGLQFAGIVNIARNVSGVQFAGIVNIARKSDVPIGLVNIIREGEMGVSVNYNEAGSIMADFRSGGRVSYGILGVGYNHKLDDGALTIQAGYGFHINCTSWFRINNEFKAMAIDNTSSKPIFISNYALLPAFRFCRHYEIFGGPSINYFNTTNMEGGKILPGNSIWKKYREKRLEKVYIGYQVGLQYIF